MTRRGIPRLYSLPPTLPARQLSSASARRDEVSVRGTGQAGFSGSGWAARGRGLGEVWKTRRGGDLLRAGWRGLAVWTAHFGAACQNCTRRSPNGPGRTRRAAMESSSPGRPRVRGGSAGHRQAGATSRRAISAVAPVGAGRRWAPRRVLRPKRSSGPGFRLPSSLPTVVFRLAKYPSSTRRAVVRKKKEFCLPGQTWLLYGERHWDGVVVATVVFEPEAASRHFTGIGEEER